jgi:peptidoglycan-associated lipoprotein
MKMYVALTLAFAVFGCASDPALDDSAKAGVEDRTADARRPGGPTAAPLKPGAGPGARGVPATPSTAATPGVGVGPGSALSRVSPLKDPASVLSQRSIYYDYDSDAIKDQYRTLVQAHAKYLSDNPGAKMLIQGNCDERGSREYNIALGQRRADGVKRMLVLLGARDGQIEAVSLGEEKPRCVGTGEDCMAQNRRSDMLYAGEF